MDGNRSALRGPAWLGGKLIAACLGAMTIAAASLPWASAQDARRDEARSSAPPTRVFAAGQVYLETSRVFVHVDKTGLGHEHAVEGQLRSGWIRLDVAAGAGELVFDMATFVADGEAARKYLGLEGTTGASTQQQVTANMRGKDVLDVAQYPTATFKITSVAKLEALSRRGLPQYQLDGEFSLHGVSRPLRTVADVEERDGWLHLRGGFSILQSHFGITPYTKAFGAVGVADPLQIWGDLWIARQHLELPVAAQARP